MTTIVHGGMRSLINSNSGNVPTQPGDLVVMQQIASAISSKVPTWSPTGDPCMSGEWQGVQCSNLGYIQNIVLSGTNLGVSIDVFDNIYKLSQLVTLELSSCNILQGTLEPKWSQLGALDKLFLANNPKLGGVWPSQWNYITMPLLGNINVDGSGIQSPWGYYCAVTPTNNYVTNTCTGSGTFSIEPKNVNTQPKFAQCTTSSVPSGYYVTALCDPGTYYRVGSDRVLAACTQPNSGQYVQVPCQPGSATTLGTDTIIAKCSSTPTSLQDSYVVSFCAPGNAMTAGSDWQVAPCTTAATGQYYTAVCVPGSVVVPAKGSNSVVQSCTSTSVPTNNYIVSPCITGTLTKTGSDRVVKQCTIPASNQYVIANCITGTAVSSGKDTVLKLCSSPPSGNYTIKICYQGDILTKTGTDTQFDLCGDPLPGQKIIQACYPGSYNAFGSPNLFSSIKAASGTPFIQTANFIYLLAGIGILLLLTVAILLKRRQDKKKEQMPTQEPKQPKQPKQPKEEYQVEAVEATPPEVVVKQLQVTPREAPKEGTPVRRTRRRSQGGHA